MMLWDCKASFVRAPHSWSNRGSVSLMSETPLLERTSNISCSVMVTRFFMSCSWPQILGHFSVFTCIFNLGLFWRQGSLPLDGPTVRRRGFLLLNLKGDIILFPNVWFPILSLKKGINCLAITERKRNSDWISLSVSFAILFSRCGLDIF